jgi:hypothetical protein
MRSPASTKVTSHAAVQQQLAAAARDAEPRVDKGHLIRDARRAGAAHALNLAAGAG